MITGITLENFKGISEPATIPIRPLTIMFGKNSAGKSTVVQALHYAREIFERNNLNPDRTLLGGGSVDLGGFQNLVNNHDDKKTITMRFEMDLRNAEFPAYYFEENLQYKRSLYAKNYDEVDSFKYEKDLSSLIESAIVEIKIEWSKVLDRPVLTSCKTWINKIEAIKILTSIDEKNIRVEFNDNHDLLLLTNNYPVSEEQIEASWCQIEIYGYETTLPPKSEPLIMVEGEADEMGIIDDLSLTQMLVAPIDLLREWLGSFRYLGPLRATPPRNFQPALTEDESDWANGLAAWRELYNMNDFFFDLDLMIWLEEKLKTGYIVELKQFREVPLKSPLMIALMNNTVFDDIGDSAITVKQYPIQKKLVLIEKKSGLEVMPDDIGVGISQVMPVIVAALISNHRMIAIEQPELHLHPAMQAELGDLFIDSALGDKNNFFLIETHSEHLILRILRRIRETTRRKAETSVNPEDLSLLFVGEVNKQTDFLNLRIDKNGRIIDRVPGGFFEEDFAEIF